MCVDQNCEDFDAGKHFWSEIPSSDQIVTQSENNAIGMLHNQERSGIFRIVIHPIDESRRSMIVSESSMDRGKDFKVTCTDDYHDLILQKDIIGSDIAILRSLMLETDWRTGKRLHELKQKPVHRIKELESSIKNEKLSSDCLKVNGPPTHALQKNRQRGISASEKKKI